MENLILFLILATLGYLSGSWIEKRHLRSIEQRERYSLKLPLVTIDKAWRRDRDIESARLVTGSAVISIDYFKRILAALRNIFGGEIASYESLIDRARREALLRMKSQVRSASIILNVRIETSAIGYSANRKGNLGSVEAIAYGTAVWLKK